MADVMLPLFNNMPRVMLAVKDHEEFRKDRAPLAVYDAPDIVINPNHPPTSTFNDLKGTICHELIHAWLHRKGLDGEGEFLDDHHNEWFVKKALEINKMNIDGLKVDLRFLLTTPRARQIYNRLSGTSISIPCEEIRDIKGVRTQLLELFGLTKNDYFLKVIISYFAVLIVSLFLRRARLIPDDVVSFLWSLWAIAALIWLNIETWKELSHRRLSRINIRKKAMSWPEGVVIWVLGLGMVVLLVWAIWLLRSTLLLSVSMNPTSYILVFAGLLIFIFLAILYMRKANWSYKE